MIENENPTFEMDITEFLLNNTAAVNATADISPGDRFTAAGQYFTIRTMTATEFDDLSNQCTKTKVIKGQRESKFDSRKFNEMSIIMCTVKPNFRDAEFLKKAGCNLPEQAINKLLLPGEIAFVAAEISALSGFDKTLEDKREEIKND